MKQRKQHSIFPALIASSIVLMAELCPAHLLAAAVPTEWTVRIGPRSASYQAERRHGDALDLRATLTYNGQPLAYTGPARLYAQTNGMGSAWWDLAPCTVVSNTLQATWLPDFDTGADVVDIFLGGPSNYQASARIRFLPSPGSVPNPLPLPAPTLDFATIQILNPPYYTRQETDNAIESAAPGDYSTVSNRAMSAIQEHQSLEPSTNYTDRTLGAFAATGTVARAATYGSPTHWTDATGCVWEVGYRYDNDWVADSSRVTQVEWLSAGYVEDPDLWAIYFTVDGSIQVQVYEYPPGTTQTNFTISASSWEAMYEGAFDFNIYRSPHTTTNLVGRVALTNDIASATSEVLQSAIRADAQSLSHFAATGTVHAAESSTYSVRLFDSSFDAAYNATELIRESTNAATAVSSSLVRYSLVTPGVWEFSGSGYDPTKVYAVGVVSANGYFYELDIDGDYADESAIRQSDDALVVEFTNAHITATRASLPGYLCDRAVNDVSLSSPTNITLPAISHPGQARDFILLLDIPSSVTNTVPAITNLLTFTPSGAETVHYYVDGDDPSTATFPLPTSPGTWSYSFTEFKTSWFAVSLKPIVEVVPPSQSNGVAQ